MDPSLSIVYIFSSHWFASYVGRKLSVETGHTVGIPCYTAHRACGDVLSTVPDVVAIQAESGAAPFRSKSGFAAQGARTSQAIGAPRHQRLLQPPSQSMELYHMLQSAHRILKHPFPLSEPTHVRLLGCPQASNRRTRDYSNRHRRT